MATSETPATAAPPTGTEASGGRSWMIIPVLLVLGVGTGMVVSSDRNGPRKAFQAYYNAVYAKDSAAAAALVSDSFVRAQISREIAGTVAQTETALKGVPQPEKAKIMASLSKARLAAVNGDVSRRRLPIMMKSFEGQTPDFNRMMSPMVYERTGIDEFRVHHEMPGSNVLVFRRSAPAIFGGKWRVAEVIAPSAPSSTAK